MSTVRGTLERLKRTTTRRLTRERCHDYPMAKRRGNPDHPTKAALLATAISLLDERSPESITLGDVLTESGISSGSLYHHFGDLDNLIESAMVVRFARGVDWSIDVLGKALEQAEDSRDLAARLHQVTLKTQSSGQAGVRRERIQATAHAAANERFRVALAPEQQRLTDGIAAVWGGLQERGLVSWRIDAQAGALFIQAYTLGVVLNDITADPLTDAAWIGMIDAVVDQVFVGLGSTNLP